MVAPSKNDYSQVPLHDLDEPSEATLACSPEVETDDENAPLAVAASSSSASSAIVPVDDAESDSEHGAAILRTTSPSHAPGANAAAKVTAAADGVFANLSAKPEPAPRVPSPVPSVPAELPPSYDQAVVDPAPEYITTVYTESYGVEDGELLIGDMPVGSSMYFVLATLASVAFQLPGFLLTFMIATTHAARDGAKAGLGLTLLQYGMFLRHRVEDIEEGTDPTAREDFNESLPPDTSAEEAGEILDRTEWIAWMFILAGWFMIATAAAHYYKMRKLRALVRAAPESLVV